MATISSPRTSIALSSASSRNASPARTLPGSRANRAALRDYYNLKPSSAFPATLSETAPSEDGSESVQASELDESAFDAELYVRQILAEQSLESILKTEAGLLSDIRNLDGEKKALVYDNYSKLIAATDTIHTMRDNMTPLAPMTGSLKPSIDRIVATVETLVPNSSTVKPDTTVKPAATVSIDSVANRKQACDTIRWVLATPDRLRLLRETQRDKEAEADWKEIKGLLDEWGTTVGGRDEIVAECEEIMRAPGLADKI